jgi:hypothetical protein
MTSSWKVAVSFAVMLCLVAAGGYAWFNRGPSVEQAAKEAEVAKARQNRDTKSAEWLVELKNSALAGLENGEFARADPSWLNLATSGMHEPLGRDWTIERLLAAEAIDPKQHPTAYDEAVEHTQTSMDLETALEPHSPERHYLDSKLGQARRSSKARIYQQHIAAGNAPSDPVLWGELYQAQRAGTDSDRRESEGTLKTLKDIAGDNLYVQLEWLGVQARRHEPQVAATLAHVCDLLRPLLAEQGADAAARLDRLAADIRADVEGAKWSDAASKVAQLVEVANKLPEVSADQRRVERPLSWHIVSDFSHAYYKKHHIERRLPSAARRVQFREVELPDALAKIADARDARFIDFDGDGRLEIAVLRGESLEIFSRGPGNQWQKAASVGLPRAGYEHFLTVALGGGERAASSASPGPKPADGSKSPASKSPGPSIDFVLFGPAGALVVSNHATANGQRKLEAIDDPDLSRASKDALSIAAYDLNEDGLIDLVVATRASRGAKGDSAMLHVFANQGGRHFRDITPRSGFAGLPVGSGSLVAVDWDNDLDVDLLVPGIAHSSGPAGFTYLKGRGYARFRPQRFPIKDSDIQSATALAVLDADSNGSWDLLAAGPHGMVLLLTSTIEHARVETLGVEAVSDFAFERALPFDYDNDGCPDLLAWNATTVRAFHGSPEGHFEPADGVLPATLADGTISSADFGDFDQDGDSDLIVVKPVTQEGEGRVALLQNEGGNANNWIDVRLDGRTTDGKRSVSARVPPFGRGSTLCLKIKGVSQTQIADKPVTHFGIGALDSADVLRIQWPTGAPVNVLTPAKNTTVMQAAPR